MGFQEKYDMSLLVNETERYVVAELEAQLKLRPEVCRCQECVLDMVALALNRSKPVYRVTLLGSIYAQAEDDSTAHEVSDAVTGAVDRIFAHPSHARA